MARRKGRRKKRRYSARGSSPRRRGGRRRGRRFGRGVKLSVISKAALATAGLVPVVISGGSAINQLMKTTTVSGADASIMSKLTLAAAQFANELAVGFGLSTPFPTLTVFNDAGGSASIGLVAVAPSGSFLKLTAVATGVVIADAVRSWLLNFATRRGGRAARVMGQNVTTGR